MDDTHEPENELEQPAAEDACEDDAEASVDDAADLQGEDSVEADSEEDSDEVASEDVVEDEAPSEVIDETVDETAADDAEVDLDEPESVAEEADDDADAVIDEEEYEASEDEPADDYEPVADPDDDFGLPLPDTDFDIAGALAQVSALSDVMAEEEARQSQEMAQIEAERQAAVERAERRASHTFPAPGVVLVERGRMASFIPALLLIAIGAYLTFLTTSSTDFSLDTGIVLAGVGVAFGVLMLVDWLASGRWHYGSLFGGLSLILSVAVLYWLSQNDDPGVQGWPLVVCAIGVAAILSAILSAERRGIQAFAGLLLILAGAVGMVVTTEALGEEITDLAQTAGPVVLIVIAVLLAIPGLLRWRRG